MAIPARLETFVDKLGVMTAEHLVNPGPEQAQGRCALLACGQVRPPDGPLAPGLGRLPLSQLTDQRREVREVGSEFSSSVPLSLDVLAVGAQAPVKPLIFWCRRIAASWSGVTLRAHGTIQRKNDV